MALLTPKQLNVIYGMTKHMIVKCDKSENILLYELT